MAAPAREDTHLQVRRYFSFSMLALLTPCSTTYSLLLLCLYHHDPREQGPSTKFS